MPNHICRSTMPLLAALGLAACSSGSTAATTVQATTTAPTTTAPTTAAPATTVPATTVPALDPHAIIYQGPGHLLMTINPDGSGHANLIPDGALKVNHPDWSPDGTKLVFVDEHPDDTTAIWVSDSDGHHSHHLIDCTHPCAVVEDPAWSPDGTKIAYYTFTVDGPEDLRIADATTGKVLTSIPAGKFRSSDHPRWSPDGRHIAVEVGQFVSYTADGPYDSGIGVVDVSAPKPTIRVITPPGTKAGFPGWSPDGTEIVFHAGNLDFNAEGGPRSDIYVIHPDGSGMRRLTHVGTDDPMYTMPSWSYDGREILLTTIRPHFDYRIARLDPTSGVVTDIRDPSGAVIGGAHTRQR
jgi:TolB protein